MVRAARSPGRRFHLANVVWSRCEAPGNDNVLVLDIDSVLRRSALRGASMVGRDGTAVVSMAKRALAKGPLGYVRHAPVRLRAGRRQRVRRDVLGAPPPLLRRRH